MRPTCVSRVAGVVSMGARRGALPIVSRAGTGAAGDPENARCVRQWY